jgi:hypothetical protein
MRARSLGLLALSLSVAVAPAATLITFDDLPASSGGVLTPFIGRTVPSNYSSLATFSVPGGALYVYGEAAMWPGNVSASPNPLPSIPNVVCPATEALASSAMCTSSLLVTFSQAMSAVSFWVGAWDNVGSSIQVLVTGQGGATAQFSVTSPQQINTQSLVNVTALSGISNIVSLLIAPPTTGGDSNGTVFDNFSFEVPFEPPPPPSVPEPSTFALVIAGVAGLVWSRRS